MLSPHVDLLLRCAAPRRCGRLRVDGATDWERFATLVDHHGMAPQVHRVLHGCGDVPDAVSSRLRSADEAASARNLLLTARLLHLTEDFARAGIAMVTLKGPALSQQLYGDPGLRDSVDLDLLIGSDDVERAAALLGARGYVLESNLGWLGMRALTGRCTELTFRNTSGTAVDLHWETAPTDYPCRIPARRVWSSVTTVSIADRGVPVLSAECLLVYLCIHGARHCWTKLRWVCDVAALVSNHKRWDWDAVFVLAREARAEHALTLGLALAHGVLGAELPPDVQRRIAVDATVAPLIAETLRRLEAPTPSTEPTSVQRTMFGARLAASGWLRARHVAALLRAPTDADAEVLKLPHALVLLYYPFRVARLAAKYGRALVAG